MFRYRLALLLLVPLAGCLDEAPHSNPFDPDSDRYTAEGVVAGAVTGIYPPYEGRAGVRVWVMPLDGGVERIATTEADGTFTVDAVPAGTYLVRAVGDGLRAVEDTVEVRVGLTAEVEFRADALPIILSQAARTVHIERWFPEAPLFQLEVEAIVTDPDEPRDIASVELVVDDVGFRRPLAQVAPGHYQFGFNAESLPGGQVQAFLGRPIRLEVTDVNGNVGRGEAMTLVRVIDDTPLTASPQARDTVSVNPPVLEWRPADVQFPFTYRVEVYLVDGAGASTRIVNVTGIDPSMTSYTLGQPLTQGDYFWTVWIVDASGNRSRSKTAGFRVL